MALRRWIDRPRCTTITIYIALWLLKLLGYLALALRKQNVMAGSQEGLVFYLYLLAF